MVQILNCESSGKQEQDYDYNMNKKRSLCDLTGLLALTRDKSLRSPKQDIGCLTQKGWMNSYKQLKMWNGIHESQNEHSFHFRSLTLVICANFLGAYLCHFSFTFSTVFSIQTLAISKRFALQWWALLQMKDFQCRFQNTLFVFLWHWKKHYIFIDSCSYISNHPISVCEFPPIFEKWHFIFKLMPLVN